MASKLVKIPNSNRSKSFGKTKNTVTECSRETTKDSARGAVEKKKRNNSKGPLKIPSTFEGAVNYTVVSLIRNPGPHAEYFVTEGEVTRCLRLEPKSRSKLKFQSEILKKIKNEKTSSEERFYTLEFLEYGTNASLKTNYLVTNAYDIQLSEVQKILKTNYTPGCALNIALQTLEAIRVLHSAGFLNRNIKPSTFSIGYKTKNIEIYMSDYRIARMHIDDKTKAPREPRKRAPWLGTARYASVAAMKEQEQGRKDDIEAWIYMIYDVFDSTNGIPWKYLAKDKTINLKEALKSHSEALCEKIYGTIPEDFKKLFDLINAYKYESNPEYDKIKTILETYATEKSLDAKTCDWNTTITSSTRENAIIDVANKSGDNKCSGEDDFEGAVDEKKKKKEKAKIKRKIMNPNDTVNNGSFVWKVVVLLGSGGFGDVYKVYNEKDPKKVNYALKTESEEGTKTMLRLKVEMQVMMTISDLRKANPKSPNHRHFVEFVDRGKSDELKCKFIVMSLVGPSLDDCRKKYKVDLSEKQTPYIIGIQTLRAVRDLHLLGFLHRDIKPANFAVGLGVDEATIYMLDFGICRSFLDPKTKQHRAPRKSVKFLGTLRYASRSCMKCVDQGRKDDLECWLYMVFDVLDEENGLPWRSFPTRDKILAGKLLFFQHKFDAVFENISRKMKHLVNYVDKLEYQSVPDYDFMEKKIKAVAERCNYTVNNFKKAEWIGKLKNVPKADRFGQSDSDSEAPSGSGDDD